MKILLVGRYQTSETFNGPEKVAKRLFYELSKLNNEIIFAEYFFDGKQYSIWKKLFGFERIENKVFRFGLFSFLKYLFKYRPDIIHIITFERFAIIGFIAKLFFGTKIIYHVHGVIKHERLYFEERIPLSTKLKDSFLEYVIFKFSDKIIFLSDQSIAIAKRFYKFDDKIATILPNGVDEIFINQAHAKKNEVVNILFLATPNRKVKGFEFATEIIKNLKSSLKIFIIYNLNNDSENISKRIKIIPKMEIVEYSKFLSKIDFVVSTSKYDPFPISAVEAMAVGSIPILTSQVGCSRLIKQNKNGFVFEYGDTTSFANCINNLAENKSLRKNISLNVRKSVSNLTWKRIAKSINAIYLEI